MSYIDPSKVISPKNHVSNVEAVYDTGPQQESWSVATFDWNDTPVVGIRWNGEPGEGVGTPPQSRDLPTWFVVPDELSAVVREVAEKLARGGDAHLTAAYREMASDEAREREAEKWAEGLIGDASPQR